MRFIVQVRIEPDNDTEASVVDVAVVERGELSLATLGLSIDDAKTILAGVQESVVAEHCATALEEASCCTSCGRRYAHKDERRLNATSAGSPRLC